MAMVTWDVEGAVATVVMRRSEKLNSLNTEMIYELRAALEAAAGQSRVVVLRAEPGVKVFSAGHDISEVPVHASAHEWDNPVEELITGIADLPVPVVAAVQGTVWGAATNLVVACDVVVATLDASFAITPAKLGVPYFARGVSIFARSLPLHVVRGMFFTATALSAVDAHRYGMVHALAADADHLDEEVAKVTAAVSVLAPLTIRSVKAQLAALDPLAPADLEGIRAARDAAWLSEDVKEGVAAFQERRRPNFQGR